MEGPKKGAPKAPQRYYYNTDFAGSQRNAPVFPGFLLSAQNFPNFFIHFSILKNAASGSMIKAQKEMIFKNFSNSIKRNWKFPPLSSSFPAKRKGSVCKTYLIGNRYHQTIEGKVHFQIEESEVRHRWNPPSKRNSP